MYHTSYIPSPMTVGKNRYEGEVIQEEDYTKDETNDDDYL